MHATNLFLVHNLVVKKSLITKNPKRSSPRVSVVASKSSNTKTPRRYYLPLVSSKYLGLQDLYSPSRVLHHGIAFFLPPFLPFGPSCTGRSSGAWRPGFGTMPVIFSNLCNDSITWLVQQFLYIIISTMISNPAGWAIRDHFCNSHPTNDNRTTTCSSNPTNRLLSWIDWTVPSEASHIVRTCQVLHTKYKVQ